MNTYRFIDTQKADHKITDLCAVVGVPASSYFDWHRQGRARAEARAGTRRALVARIEAVHAASDGTYGSDRVHAELARQGVTVARRTVAETMSEEGIVGVSGRERSTTTTRRDRLAAPFPDLVRRRFQPATPDTLWYGDVTYIWVKDRFWYLATVIDAATKEVVGWACEDHMRTSLVSDALHRAVRRRGGRVPPGLIFHSDRGAQYTSTEYGTVCAMYKIRQSMGRRGVCYDNAAAESFFATIKRELIKRYHLDTPESLHRALFHWIEIWYNRHRLHSSVGYRPPVEAYNDHITQQAAA